MPRSHRGQPAARRCQGVASAPALPPCHRNLLGCQETFKWSSDTVTALRVTCCLHNRPVFSSTARPHDEAMNIHQRPRFNPPVTFGIYDCLPTGVSVSSFSPLAEEGAEVFVVLTFELSFANRPFPLVCSRKELQSSEDESQLLSMSDFMKEDMGKSRLRSEEAEHGC
ncbi:hypothetical protein EYF80_029062 [Liparis tanakae]|uniref:Uncharacterized protein n=1 Tax=Liparis tanakae TaxID=230148 RepID=A0A4Z2H4E2_9TELE|nr:hypothetical protein EYF80_029062 [Liparis tanakae]